MTSQFITVTISLLFANVVSQSYHSFGSYEYYWTTDSETHVKSYSQAEHKCNQQNATMAIVNDSAIGKFLKGRIGVVASEFDCFVTKCSGLRRLQ